MTRAVLMILTVFFCSCGKNEPKQVPKVSKAAPIMVTQTLGMKAAEKGRNEGRYRDAVRLFSAELSAEEAKPAPSYST